MALVGSIAGHASAIRLDARLGPFANPGSITLAPDGVAVAERGTVHAYRWGEVEAVARRRGRIELRMRAPRERTITTKDGAEVRRYVDTRVFRFVPVLDGVREPTLMPTLMAVLEDMAASRFTFNGTTWHEYQNAVERVRGQFAEQDEPVIAAAAAGMWIAVGLLFMFMLPIALNLAMVHPIAPGTFVLRDRIGPLDPRVIVAAFSLSALTTMGVLRVALGSQALVWARGVARGWKHGGVVSRATFQLVGRVLLATSTAATFTLLALLTFWPNVAATGSWRSHSRRTSPEEKAPPCSSSTSASSLPDRDT